MYTLRQTYKRTNIKFNNSIVGETIEQKIRRIVNNKEPITDGAPIIFTERKDGVLPGHDIRTDRFEIAVDAMDKVSKTEKAKREERHKTPEQKESEKRAKEAKEGMKKEGETGGEKSAQLRQHKVLKHN